MNLYRVILKGSVYNDSLEGTVGKRAQLWLTYGSRDRVTDLGFVLSRVLKTSDGDDWTN
jgi:hypothetical protein